MNNCYIKVSWNTGYQYAELPCYPDELSESTSATWADEAIIGRSSPISAYTGTSYRSCNFSFLLHREMTSNIEDVLKIIRSSLYPLYESGGIDPPITTFRLGDFYMKGIVRSVSFNWKKPIKNDKYHLCEVSVSIDTIPTKVMSANDLKSSVNPFDVYLTI